MRKVSIEYNVYRFEELTEKSKELVRDWYLNCQESYIFTEMCEDRLHELFPESNLNVQYSLSNCQGDGLNIFGTIMLDELLEKIFDKFNEKEIKFFKWVFSEVHSEYKMPMNRRYCYCICDRNDYFEDVLYYLDQWYYRNIPEKTIDKFNKYAQEYLCNLCKEMEENGYSYFYEISDSDLQEYCNDNDYEFLENGKLFVA